MYIGRPVKTNNITQLFGESKVCTRTESGVVVFPYDTAGKKDGVCPFNYIDLYEHLGMKGHAGLDLKAYRGEPIYFDIKADVEWECRPMYSSSTGYGILIRSKQPIPLTKCPVMPGASMNLAERQYRKLGGVHLMRYFGHMNEATFLKDKDSVKYGQLVGYAGTTGASTGVHVHRHLLVSDETSWFYLDGDSDYKGRFDESEWFTNTFVGDDDDSQEIRGLQLTVIQLATQVISLLERLIAAKRK